MKYLLIFMFVALVACKSQETYLTTTVKNEPEIAEKREVVAKGEEPMLTYAEKEKEPGIIVRSEAVNLTNGKSMDKYYIIVGSFANEFNATSLRQILADLGFEKSCILRNREGLYRVAIDCFEKEASARSSLLELRTRYPQYSSAWLLITQ